MNKAQIIVAIVGFVNFAAGFAVGWRRRGVRR